MTIRIGCTPIFDIAKKEEVSVYVTEQFDMISYEVMFVELSILNCKHLYWTKVGRAQFPKHIEKIAFSLEKEYNGNPT